MYISTNHSINDTVYVYDKETDSVQRGTVTEIHMTKCVHDEHLTYLVAFRDGASIAYESDIHNGPDLAFYRNPMPASEPVEA
jgi:hypothetical protein